MQPTDLYSALRNAQAAGDTEAVNALAAYIKQLEEVLAPPKPAQDTTGFKAAASAGMERMKGEAALTAAKAGLLDPAEAERIYAAQEEKAKQRFTPTEEGWLEAPWQKLKETAGGSLPYMAAPAVVGGLGALAATGVGAPAAAGIAGAGLAGLAGAAQYTGTNLARQMEQGKTLEETSGEAALAAAIPQAALDVVSMRMIPGLGRIFGAAGKEVTEETAKALAQQTLKQAAVDYAKATGKVMGVEGLTEVGQQALERLQAGLSITDSQAREEYFDSFIGGAALAGALGPVGRAAERGQIQREGSRLAAERQQEETRIAREAQQAQEEQLKLAEEQQFVGDLFPETMPEGPRKPAEAAVEPPPPEAPADMNRRIMLLEQAIEAQQEQMQGATPEQTLAFQPRIQKLREALAKAREEAGVPAQGTGEFKAQLTPLYKQAKATETRMKNAQGQGDEVAAAKYAQKLIDLRQQIAALEGPQAKAQAFEAAQAGRTAPVQEGLFSDETLAANAAVEQRLADEMATAREAQAAQRAQEAATAQRVAQEAEGIQRLGKGPEYAGEVRAERKEAAESQRLNQQLTGAQEQLEMFPDTRERLKQPPVGEPATWTGPVTQEQAPPVSRPSGIGKNQSSTVLTGQTPTVSRTLPTETPRPKKLQILLDRAKAAPNVDDATRALIDRVDAELPRLQQAAPFTTPAGTAPVEYVSPTGKAITAPAAVRRVPLMDVAAFLSRVAQGRDASAEAAQVQNHLARLEEGKRSETEQRTQYAQRALTAAEKQAVQGTALAEREGVMTRAPSGETATAIQTEMPFEEGKSPAERKKGVAFESFAEFDKFLAGDALQILRNSMQLSGETVSRLMQAVGPKMKALGELRAKLLPLVERQRALRAAAAQEKEAGKTLLKETEAEVTRLYLESHMVIADLYAKRDAAVQALADAQAQAAQLTTQLQQNAAALKAKIAQQPSLDAAVREREQAVQTALTKIEEITTRLQKLEADPAVQFESSLDKDWSEHSEDTVKYLAVRKAIRIAKEDLRKASAAYNAARTSLLDLQTGVSQRAYATPPAITTLVEESMALDAKLAQNLTNVRKRMGGLTAARNNAVQTLAAAQAQINAIPEFKQALDTALQERATAEQLKLEADADAAKTQAQADALNAEASAIGNAIATLTQEVTEATRGIPGRAKQAAQARMPQETTADREARDAERRKAEQARMEKLAEREGERVTFAREDEASVYHEDYMEALDRRFDKSLSEEERAKAALKVRALQEKMTKAEQDAAKALFVLTARRAEKLASIANLKENHPKQVKTLEREEAILANTEKALEKLRKAMRVRREIVKPRAERKGEVERIAQAQTERRATSPLMRETSPTPTQLRTGTAESKAGETRVGSAQRPFESTKVTERNIAVGKAEQQEANVEAERIRKETAENAKLVDGVLDLPLDEAIRRLEEVIKSSEKLVAQARKRANEAGIEEAEARKRDQQAMNADNALTKAKLRLETLQAQKAKTEAAAQQKAAPVEAKKKEVKKARATAKKAKEAAPEEPTAKEAEQKKVEVDESLSFKKVATEKPADTGVPPKQEVDAAELLKKELGVELDTEHPLNGKSFAEAARQLAENQWKAPQFDFFRTLALRLAEVFDTLPTDGPARKLYISKSAMTTGDGRANMSAGKYLTAHNLVVVHGDAAGMAHVVLHELVHAASVEALTKNKEFAKQATALMERARAWLSSDEGQAYMKGPGAWLLRKSATVNGAKMPYGLKNTLEFLAEAYSDRNFQQFLAQIPSDKPEKSLLTRLVEKIADFLNLSTVGLRSTLAETIALTDEIFTFTKSEIFGDVAPTAAHDMIFDSVAAEPMPGVPSNISDIVNRTVGRSATIGDKIAAFASGLRWRTAIADRWAPAEALLKRGVAKGSIDEVRALQSRIHMRIHEQQTQFIETAALDGVPQLTKQPDGTFLVEGKAGANLRQIANVLAKANIGNEQYTERVFTTWLAILRAEKDGIGYDKLNFDKPLTAREAQALKDFVANNPETKKSFDEARALYKDYNKNLLNLLVDASVMSREKADELLKGDYVPYYRERGGVVELVVGGSKPVQIGNVIDQPYLKELIGGQENILPFFSGAMQNTSMLMRMALRNLQTKDMAYLLQDLGMTKIHEGDGPAGMRVVHFKQKGKNYWAELDQKAFPEDIPADLMLSGMQGIKTAVPWLVKIMGMPANILRKTVTRMPLYALRQTIRDPLHAWLTTGGDFTPIISSYKELGKMVTGKNATEDMLKRAAVISSNVYTGDPQDAAKTLRDVMSGKGAWNAAMEKLDNFALQGDAATRAVLYNMYRKKGMSHAQALLGTLESMNFSRRGTSASMHWLSTMVPFFNAQIQGLDAVYRAAKGDTVFQDKMDARASLYRRGALVTAATIAYALMMQDDEAYKNATPEERAMNWFVRVPGLDEPIRVPIPFELGLVFKTVPEMVINTAFGDTKAEEAVKALGKQLWMSSPLSIPTGVKGPIELAANYSFFSDQPIESERERNMTADQRYRQNTTELAKILGSAGVLSPVQIEHLVRSYTGGMGVLLMSLANPVLRPFGTEADIEKPERKLSELPVIGGLFQPNTGRGLVNAAFKDVESYQQAAQTFKELAKNPAEARAYADRYAREMTLASTGGAFRQMMGEFASMKRMIASSTTMSPSEKRDRIETIKQQEIKLAQKLRELTSV